MIPNAYLLLALMVAAAGAVAWVALIEPRIEARHEARWRDLDSIYDDGGDL